MLSDCTNETIERSKQEALMNDFQEVVVLSWHFKSDGHAQCPNVDNCAHKSSFDFVMKAAVPHSIQMVQLHSIESLQAICSKHVDATSHELG